MSYRISTIIMSVLLFSVLSLDVNEAEAGPEKEYIALGSHLPPDKMPPTNPPWVEADSVMPLPLIPDGNVWVALDNDYDPNKKKVVTVFVKSDSANDINLVAACGFTSGGSTIGVSVDKPIQSGTFKEWDVEFAAQPDFEMVRIKNEGTSTADITDVEMDPQCVNNVSLFDYDCYLSSAGFGTSGYPLGITQLLFGHEFASVNQLVPPTLQLSVPGDTWVCEYVTTDPNTGEPIPQGAWLWTCVMGDGIAETEDFEISMTINECMPEGKCLLYAYDSLGDEWKKFRITVDEIAASHPDLNGDCKIDFYDVAVLSNDWLRGVEVVF